MCFLRLKKATLKILYGQGNNMNEQQYADELQQEANIDKIRAVHEKVKRDELLAKIFNNDEKELDFNEDS